MDGRGFKTLKKYLEKVPAIKSPIFTGIDENGFWWIKFSIDIENKYAWHVVQELGCVVNYLSIDERLPTVFYPVSPAPYMNGGPAEYLTWVIETKDKNFKPNTLKEGLEGRLPHPVDDLEQWDEAE
ncbi:MAG TPA: hypothetical protein PKD18_02840 [Saprospiraceae bacterium]|nr:hypothetical protein [Saprospiraceae bacterium]